MCGRYSVLTEDEIIEVRGIIKSVALTLARDEFDHYEAERQETAPTDLAPIITSNGRELEFVHAQFGFRKWDGKGVIINARSESINEKSMFRNQRRCVVPASEYYEWKLPGEGQKKKIKHQIKDKQGNLLFMAGLWRDGKDGREFVVITKNPVGEVADIHDRMPVMLRTDQLEPWLSGSLPIEALTSLDFDCAAEPLDEPDKEGSGSEQLTMF